MKIKNSKEYFKEINIKRTKYYAYLQTNPETYLYILVYSLRDNINEFSLIRTPQLDFEIEELKG